MNRAWQQFGQCRSCTGAGELLGLSHPMIYIPTGMRGSALDVLGRGSVPLAPRKISVCTFLLHLERQREAVLGHKGWLGVSPPQVDVSELDLMISDVFSNLRGSLSL